MSSAVEESYVVKLANGARSMTVEELDAALDAGIITPSTQVLAPGAMNWSTLGELAGLEEEEICTPPIFVAPPAFAQGYVTPPPGFASSFPPATSVAPIVPPSPPSLAPMAFAPTSSIVLPDSADELAFAGRRRAAKIVGYVFGAAAAIAIVFGIQSAISQSIASSAAQAALAAQPPAPPPPAASPLPPPAALPPVVAKVAPPAPPPAAAAPASPVAKVSPADKKKNKLPGSPSSKKKK